MATVAHALKQMKKAGLTVYRSGRFYCANVNGKVLSFLPNGEDGPTATTTCHHVRREKDESRPEYDSFAGYFVDNVKQMIEAGLRP